MILTDPKRNSGSMDFLINDSFENLKGLPLDGFVHKRGVPTFAFKLTEKFKWLIQK